MENGAESGPTEPSIPNAPAPQALPLFFPGTPSMAGTPVRRHASNAPDSTPLRGMLARRAVGIATPKGTPLFARELHSLHRGTPRLMQPTNSWQFLPDGIPQFFAIKASAYSRGRGHVRL